MRQEPRPADAATRVGPISLMNIELIFLVRDCKRIIVRSSWTCAYRSVEPAAIGRAFGVWTIVRGLKTYVVA
jgi:hypothetical protein